MILLSVFMMMARVEWLIWSMARLSICLSFIGTPSWLWLDRWVGVGWLGRSGRPDVCCRVGGTGQKAMLVTPPSAPPMKGPRTGTQAYPQSEVPLFLIGRIACARRGPRSRAGLMA